MGELRGAVDLATLDELRESVGDDPAFVGELIDDFLADAPSQLESLRTAAESGDAAGARLAAHTLKGNSRTFGATELAAVCQEAETAANEGDLAAVVSRLDAMHDEWERVRAELVAFRAAGR